MKRRVSIPVAVSCVAALLAAALPAPRAAAQAVVATGESFLSGRLVLGERDGEGARRAGLVIDIAPGWKTYWRNPGESGLPPSFDWSGSENLAGVEIDWPRPMAFESFGLRTLGYAGQVVLPLTLVPEDPARPVSLRLAASLGVCREICVLEEMRVEAGIAPGDAPAGAALIADALALVPPPGAEAGVEILACRVAGAGETRRFSARLSLPDAVPDPIVVLEGPEGAWFHGETVVAEGREVGIDASLSLLSAADWVDRSAIRITVLGPDLAADLRGCTAAGG